MRHGPTHERAILGRRDVPADLSDTAALARLHAALPAGALLVSSDLARATATADALAGSRERLPHEPDLREFDFGAWDGLTPAAVSARDPVLSRRFWEGEADLAPPGGESWADVARRVATVVDRLAAAHPGRDIVAVAHLGVILTALHRARGGRLYDTLAQRVSPLSLTEIARTAGGWQVGRVDHRP